MKRYNPRGDERTVDPRSRNPRWGEAERGEVGSRGDEVGFEKQGNSLLSFAPQIIVRLHMLRG